MGKWGQALEIWYLHANAKIIKDEKRTNIQSLTLFYFHLTDIDAHPASCAEFVINSKNCFLYFSLHVGLPLYLKEVPKVR
jgi:hypothetical protein